MDFLDELQDALHGGSSEVATAYAVAGGLNIGGSFLDAGSQPLTDRQRRSILGTISVVHLTLPAPPAPPAPFGVASQHTGCLWPRDYSGLGNDPETGVFRLSLLVEHCQAMPLASEQAALAAIQTPERAIRCAAIGCYDSIAVDAEWTVCAGCRLAVFCGGCSQRGCRICLLNSAPTTFPVRYMMDRAPSIRELTNKLPAQDSAPVYEAVIYLLATQAAYRIAGPNSSRRTCRSSSSIK